MYCVWLGFELDLDQGQLRIPEDKLQALCTQLSKTDGLQLIQAKALASVIGKAAVLAPAKFRSSDLPYDTQFVCSIELKGTMVSADGSFTVGK